MDLERLAFLVLKEAIKNERRQGEIKSVLESHGISFLDDDVRTIANFIKRKEMGTVLPIHKGYIQEIANLQAVEFVNKHNNMTFEKKLKLIYSELENLPDKKGKLEDILDKLGIDHNPHTEREFLDSFKETGNVYIAETSKDGSIIVLTQKGQDNLHVSVERQIRPNIVVEQYHHSIVNKGDNITQLGGFESGIKRDNNSAINNPITNPTPSPNPNSPTKKIQRWQLFVGIVAILAAIILAVLKKYGIL